MGRLTWFLPVLVLVTSPLEGRSETPERIKGVYERAEADLHAERYGKAYARLQWLLLHDTDDAKRTKAYQTALHRIKSKRPLSFGASAALMPSTNISKTFDGNDSLRATTGDARSGIGLRFGAFAQATESYAPGREFVARLGLGRSVYDDRHLNSKTTNISLGHRWMTAGTTYGMAGFSNRTRFEPVKNIATSDFDSAGARFTMHHILDNGHTLSGMARYETYDYANSNYLDGQKYQILGTYSVPLSTSETLNVTGGFEHADLTQDSYSYTSLTLGTRYTRVMPKGLTWGIGATHTRRDYNGLFPFEDPITRADRVTDFTVSLSHKALKIGETVPRLTCTSRQHGSNIYLYDYTSMDCSMKLQFDF